MTALRAFGAIAESAPRCTKDGIQRMLVQIPLTDEERAAAESDQDAVDRLLDRLIDTPTPSGPTPRDLNAATSPSVAQLDFLHQSRSPNATS